MTDLESDGFRESKAAIKSLEIQEKFIKKKPHKIELN
jgi:hypothetical protein